MFFFLECEKYVYLTFFRGLFGSRFVLTLMLIILLKEPS